MVSAPSCGILTFRGEKMLISMEKILFLKSVPIFTGMTGEELRSLAEIVEEKEFKSGDTIFRENEPGEEMYVIVQGRIQVFHEEKGSETTIADLGERECLGEMAILDDMPRSASARAEEDTLTLMIHRDEFCELIREEPEVAFGVFRVFTRRIRQANVEHEQAHAPMQGPI
jgi:CRP/FNR family transcriptional regulator, cyclic AMP receptor protein